MAIRKKSIKVAMNFDSPADQADNALTTMGTQTIYIPENSVGNPVTFASAHLIFNFRNANTGPDILTISATATLAGASSSTYSQTGTLADTAEDVAYVIGPIDFTTYFNTNYGTVSSKDLTIQTQIDTNNIGLRGVYGYMEITYEYDDSATTRIQTICIPHESPLSFLSTTANTVVTNMAQLTGTGGLFENYGNVVLRQRWLEIKGNTNTAQSTTDITLSFRFNAGGTTSLPVFEQAGGFDYWTQTQIDASALATNTTHTFALWSNVASRFRNVIINEWITIEYTTTGTTEFINYVELPLEVATPMAGTTTSVEHTFQRNLNIQEPSTITFLYGGVEFFYNSNGTATLQMKVGSQSVYRTYGNTGTTTAGVFGLQHGFDADSTNGAGLTLNRGDNVITVQAYRTTGLITNTTGIIRIVYKSGVETNDVGAHNNVKYAVARQWNQTTAVTDDTASDSFNIPEINYFLTAAGFNFYAATNSAVFAINFMARLLTGEGNGDGWRELYADYAQTDNEAQTFLWVARLRDDFKRYPNDPDDTRMDLEVSRSYRIAFSTAARYGYTWTVTYHTISYTISGSTQNAFTPGNVTLFLFQKISETEFRLYDVITDAGNTSFSFTVYDDTKQYIVVGEQILLGPTPPPPLVGVSGLGFVTDTFDVNLSPTSGSGSTRIYGFGSA